MGDCIVHVKLDGYHLTLLVATVAAAVRLVEVTEQRPPCFLGRGLTRQLHHRLRYHRIGFGLRVPAVFYPEAGMSVPLGHTGRVNPCHTAGIDAATYTDGLVGSNKEFGLRTLAKLTEPQPVAVHGIVEQLDGRRGTEVGIAPCPQLPHHPALVAVLQPHRLLRLRHPVIGGVHLPDGLPLTVDFLN